MSSSHKDRSMFGRLGDKFEELVEVIDDNKPILIDIKGIARAGKQCHKSAVGTSELCNETIAKAKEMVGFGLELKETLDGLSGGGLLEASKFEVISDLVDGDVIRDAISLAGDMQGLSLACVDKSQEMIGAMERGVDCLPDFLESHIENKMEEAVTRGSSNDPELPDIESHERDLKKLLSGVEDVNIFTIVTAGKEAFDGLTRKGKLCEEMFCTIQSFANNVAGTSETMRNLEIDNVGSMIGNMKDLAKDVWRCLRLSGLIKSFAEGVERLIKWIIKLFNKASSKLSSIWGALANAKDRLTACLKNVCQAMHLCDDAKSKSITLCETSNQIRGYFMNLLKMNKSSIYAFKELADGEEIKTVIDLTRNMDDVLGDCVKAVIVMIQEVTKAITSLPDVLREDMHQDLSRSISHNEARGVIDKSTVDVSNDVEELNKIRRAIEKSSLLDTAQTCADGFEGIESKMKLCGEMVLQSRGFAETSLETIGSFNGVWNIESAQLHLRELTDILSLGETFKLVSEQIIFLIEASLQVMEAVVKKMKGIDCVPDEIQNVVEDIGNKFSKFFKR